MNTWQQKVGTYSTNTVCTHVLYVCIYVYMYVCIIYVCIYIYGRYTNIRLHYITSATQPSANAVGVWRCHNWVFVIYKPPLFTDSPTTKPQFKRSSNKTDTIATHRTGADSKTKQDIVVAKAHSNGPYLTRLAVGTSSTMRYHYLFHLRAPLMATLINRAGWEALCSRRPREQCVAIPFKRSKHCRRSIERRHWAEHAKPCSTLTARGTTTHGWGHSELYRTTANRQTHTLHHPSLFAIIYQCTCV